MMMLHRRAFLQLFAGLLVPGLAKGASGATTLDTDGWTGGISNILLEGDVFTIAGVNAVNPITGEDLGILRQFVVGADACGVGGSIHTARCSGTSQQDRCGHRARVFTYTGLDLGAEGLAE